MHILVINGSPKGKHSITLQTTNYLQLLHPEHEFEILHAGQSVKALEKDFSPALEAVKKADLLLFSYPVYTFLAPCQLHRFIGLLKESAVDLSGKYASQITTSKHFYDITAHRYVEENCYDLGLKYITGLSADMDDLTTKRGQQEAEKFFDFVIWSAAHGIYEPAPAPLPAPARVAVKPAANPTSPTGGDVVVLTDCEADDSQLQSMIDRFRAVLTRRTRVINIREYPFRGGCLGCFNCAVTGKCVYKDGFDEYLRKEIQTAEAIVYAFTVKDHSMGARFKMYDDRNFCNGHRTVTIGMPIGYLISGNYALEHNLRTVVEARAQVGSNFLAGVATDEADPTAAIDNLADKLTYALEQKYLPPQNFYGIGGMKVFRDLIWIMQGMMRADHKFYKSHGQYDFPQKQWPRMVAMYGVGMLLGNPKLKSKMGNKMNEGMLMPYQKALKSAEERAKAKVK